MNFSVIFTIILIIVSVKSDSKSNRINEIRKSVLNHFSANPNSAYKSDLDLVAKNDWLIDNFLSSLYKNKDPATSLIESLKAWKNDNILELNDTSFPAEIYGLGYIWDFGVAKDGSALLGFNLFCAPPNAKVDPTIAELSLKYIRYLIRKVILGRGAKTLSIYGNYDTPNLLDVDITANKEVIQAFGTHYPRFPASSYVYKLQGALTTVVRALLAAVVPNYDKIITFVDTEAEIEKYISLDEVPAHAFGRSQSFAFIPEGVRSVKCKHLPQFNQSPADKKNWELLKDLRIDCYLKSLQSTGKSSLEEFLREC